jgi:hypothetical protein
VNNLVCHLNISRNSYNSKDTKSVLIFSLALMAIELSEIP